jgi:glucan biosynthesis protein C
MTTEPTTATTRNASLEATRGVRMMLGIVLHASNIYSEGGDWLVHDTESNPVFNVIRNSIHVFQMPIFFWILGYFRSLTFRQSGSRGLLGRHASEDLGFRGFGPTPVSPLIWPPRLEKSK